VASRKTSQAPCQGDSLPLFPSDDSGRSEGLQRSDRDIAKRLPTHLAKRRRNPDEVVTRSAAIQNQYRGCMDWNSGGLGSIAEAVRQCPATECWLWLWRNGALDPDAQRRPLIKRNDEAPRAGGANLEGTIYLRRADCTPFLSASALGLR